MGSCCLTATKKSIHKTHSLKHLCIENAVEYHTSSSEVILYISKEELNLGEYFLKEEQYKDPKVLKNYQTNRIKFQKQ